MFNFGKKNQGFTLIELLVVVAIIGLLATLSIAALNTARYQARKTKVSVDFKNITEAIIMAQGESGKTLLKITGNGCTSCACSSIGSLINIATSSSCYIMWQNALLKISDASNGLFLGITSINRDPWGSPYLLDENEGESGVCSRIDSIRSAGPDGLINTGDDISRSIPQSLFCP